MMDDNEMRERASVLRREAQSLLGTVRVSTAQSVEIAVSSVMLTLAIIQATERLCDSLDALNRSLKRLEPAEG